MVSVTPHLLLSIFLTILCDRWLVRHGKLDEARAALLRLTSKKYNPDFDVEDTLAMMIHTNELEIQQTAGTSYWDCFKGVDRRRTELTVMTWVIQQSSGSAMMGWATYFLIQVGLSNENAYSIGIGSSAMGFVGTVTSWFLMPHFGRRTLYLWGQGVMFLILIVIGGLGIPTLSSSTGWATGALLLILTFSYDITIGPVCYSLVAELPSTRLRIKSVVLSRCVYNICGIIIGTLQPHFMNPTAWNWKGKTAFFWAGTNLLGLIWTYFRLPEPKGLTYADLDVLFENKVSARRFRKVEVDPYRSDNLVVVVDENLNETYVNEQKLFDEKEGS
jgi:MFS transporter, SP family, general alpha glucoside:H+ symporter